jgi:hypothetical protein
VKQLCQAFVLQEVLISVTLLYRSELRWLSLTHQIRAMALVTQGTENSRSSNWKNERRRCLKGVCECQVGHLRLWSRHHKAVSIALSLIGHIHLSWSIDGFSVSFANFHLKLNVMIELIFFLTAFCVPVSSSSETSIVSCHSSSSRWPRQPLALKICKIEQLMLR